MLTTPLTPQSLPPRRTPANTAPGFGYTPGIGTQFTAGSQFTPETPEKESIPFQDLSKLAKRMDWAVVKMTNVFPLLIYMLMRFPGTPLLTQSLNSLAKMQRSFLMTFTLNQFT